MNLRRETARRLLARARDDQYVLASVAGDANAPIWPLGFHAQQAVEKALKAVLAAHGVEYPLTHNIAMLLARIGQLERVARPLDADELPQLTPFGVALRYDDVGEASDARRDRDRAVACVARTLDWADAEAGGTCDEA
jgi:HEPN domain-containing protein